jgi:hypothetical protein
MVNRLLTISIKVNVHPTPNHDCEKGMHMKKIGNRVSFWDWMFGSGWCSGGANG